MHPPDKRRCQSLPLMLAKNAVLFKHCWGAEGAGEHGGVHLAYLAIGQRMTRYDSKHDQRGAQILNRERPRTSKQKSADSDTPHIIAKPLQQFPSISDNVTARYFERAPRTVHQLQAPVILSFLSCNLPRCCSAGRIFSRSVPTLFPFLCCFFLGGATLQNTLW